MDNDNDDDDNEMIGHIL